VTSAYSFVSNYQVKSLSDDDAKRAPTDTPTYEEGYLLSRLIQHSPFRPAQHFQGWFLIGHEFCMDLGWILKNGLIGRWTSWMLNKG
jgi:hypothetical protein